MPSGRQNHSDVMFDWLVPRNVMTLSVVPVTTNSSVAVKLPPGNVGCTHGALDGFGGGRTSTVTVSASLSSSPSSTVSENTRSSRNAGAVKVGDAEVHDDPGASVTAGPPVCVQA